MLLKNHRFLPGFLFHATVRANCPAVQISLFVYCGQAFCLMLFVGNHIYSGISDDSQGPFNNQRSSVNPSFSSEGKRHQSSSRYTCLLTPLDVEGLRVILCIPIKIYICLRYKTNQFYLLEAFACMNRLSIFLHGIFRGIDNVTVVRIIQTNEKSVRTLLDFVGLVQEHRLLNRFHCKASRCHPTFK